MNENLIKIRGARVHNLRNVNVDISKNKLTVITGISGSGKSSLAFDVLYAEGQRRYMESLSAYARQFLGVMRKPDVDKVEGISPAIAIDQRKGAHNPRSTVGTITEIYDYLRLLFSRIGVPHCPRCGKIVSRQTPDQIKDQIVGFSVSPKSGKGGKREVEILILGPVIKNRKGEHRGILEEIQRRGFVRVRIDGLVHRVEEALELSLDKNKKHNIEVVVDRLIPGEEMDKIGLVDSVETALKLGKGIVIISQQFKVEAAGLIKSQKSLAGDQRLKPKDQIGSRDQKLKTNDLIFSERFACEDCGISLSELEPRLFSFNSPYGACPSCQGLGVKLEVDPALVIPNSNLSIAEGAIFPWAHAPYPSARRFAHLPASSLGGEVGGEPSGDWRAGKIGRQGYFFGELGKLAEKYDFSLEDPVSKLSPKVLNVILYGEKSSSTSNIQHPISEYEGVIPNLERRYRETDSDYTRQEIEQYMVEKKCEACRGKRLKPEVLAVTVAKKSIDQIVEMPVSKTKQFFESLLNLKVRDLKPDELKVAQPVIKEILNRLQFLIDIGLDYLTLDRKAATLAGGEEQRIRLATQISSKLSGVLYILDEPSVGLHPRDMGRLIKTLKKLRDLGNTVVVVEHDPQTILVADWVIDVGPRAGKEGGKVIFQGTPRQLMKSHTLTGDYLSGRKKVEISQWVKGPAAGMGARGQSLEKNQNLKTKNRTGSWSQESKTHYLIIKGAKEHNLKNINVKIPLGKLVCCTGVSGSGKSSLMNDILAKALLKKFYRAKEEPGEHRLISGTDFLNKIVLVDQSPIGRTPRSNPATYTGIFLYVRSLFAATKEARVRGYQSGRFSFNIKGGRCEACEGQGVKKIEMFFLPDIYIECEECKGTRYNRQVLEVEYRGKNIAEVLKMTVKEALIFFKNIPGLYEKLKILEKVGLDYVELGQPAPSLSGGEAQRVKLATELSKKGTGKTLYTLDEPTTGLHMDDIKKLIQVLRGLVDKGNTVLCVEHNLDVVKNADWILDLGPEGGEEGGYIVAEGTPRDIAKNYKSYTGKYLREVFSDKIL